MQEFGVAVGPGVDEPVGVGDAVGEEVGLEVGLPVGVSVGDAVGEAVESVKLKVCVHFAFAAGFVSEALGMLEGTLGATGCCLSW